MHGDNIEVSVALVAAVAIVVSAIVSSLTNFLAARRDSKRSDLSLKLDYLNQKINALKAIRENFIEATTIAASSESVAESVAASIISMYEGARLVLPDIEEWCDADKLAPIQENLRLIESSLRYHRAQAQDAEWHENMDDVVPQLEMIDLMSAIGSASKALLQATITSTRKQMDALVSSHPN